MILGELQKIVRDLLAAADIENPTREARWLLAYALAVSDADLIAGDRLVSDTEMDSVKTIVDRRVGGEPVGRIIGEKDFHGLAFLVTPDVLDPRMDTETLVDAAVTRFKDNPPRSILDLGTGSGCILIALLHAFPESTGVGADVSREALAVAAANAVRLGVAERAAFAQSDWAESVGGTFDLIVSNPPYISSGDIANLDIGVRDYDPILALDGGFDGLQAYKKIFSQIKNIFSQGGAGFFEVGISQAHDVARLATNEGFLVRGYHADSAGILRVLEIDSGEK